MLDAAAIVAEAESRVGLTDSEPVFRRNLDQLVASLNGDAKLSALGETSISKGLTTRTTDQLEGLKWLRDHPEIGNEVIVEPVFLTGLPRSGTTFFQYLFNRDERFRMIRTWESMEPSPPPGTDPESVIRRKAEEAERLRQSRPKEIKGFEAMHLLDLDGPAECHVFLEQTYAAAGLFNLYDVPSFFEYLTTSADFTATYRAHKRQLQLLQYRMPRPRWAVKYPNHVLAMDKIVAVHPEVRFVMTHRDPVQVLASISKMSATLRSIRYDTVDPKRVGHQMLGFIRRHIDRLMAFCASPEGKRVVHVDYYRLVDNPAAAMTDVHAGLGIDTPPAVREAVADWHRRNPKGARGSNPYALETYGLDGDAVAEQFQDYMRLFDIPREHDGLKRAY